MTMITIDEPTTGATPNLQAYVSRPDGDGPWPGVVMVHEALGLDDAARQHADHLAELGYLVIAPDLYTGGSPRTCLRRTMGELRSGTGSSFANIAAARDWVRNQPDSTAKIGVIGFCMGGGFALMVATDFDVSSVNYGRVPDEEVLAGACPIVGSYGRRDLTLAGASQKLAEILVRHDIEFDIKEYPNAGHAFLNAEAPKLPWFLGPLRRVMNVGPDPKAATDAWMRIDAFFGRFLR